MHDRPVLLSGAEHDQVAGGVAGRAEEQSGDPSSAVTVGDAGHDHDAAQTACIQHSAQDRLLPRHHWRRVQRRVFADRGVRTVNPQAADIETGLAGAIECLDRRVDHCGVQVRAGGVSRTGGVDGAVRVAEGLDDGWSIVEVDDGRSSTLGSDGLGLSFVAHEGGDLVPVGLELRKDVGADEPSCSRECHLHLWSPPVSVDGQG